MKKRPNGVRYGKCPWCGRRMEIGDEHPLLERMCDDCSEFGRICLCRMYPETARKYKAAKSSVVGRER